MRCACSLSSGADRVSASRESPKRACRSTTSAWRRSARDFLSASRSSAMAAVSVRSLGGSGAALPTGAVLPAGLALLLAAAVGVVVGAAVVAPGGIGEVRLMVVLGVVGLVVGVVVGLPAARCLAA